MSARAAKREGDQAALNSAWGRDAARLLALFRQERQRGVTVAAMRERGIAAPAQAIYMLQLAGYAIDRVPAAASDRQSSVYRLRSGRYQNGGPEGEP